MGEEVSVGGVDGSKDGVSLSAFALRVSPGSFTDSVPLFDICLLMTTSLSDFEVSFLTPADVEVLSSAVTGFVLVFCG